MMSSPRRVAVVGAGVVGVCSALRLAEHLAGRATVTLISEAFSPYTTGDGSAGWISPYLLGDDIHADVVRRWCKSTFDFLNELLFSPDGAECGVGLMGCYNMNTDSNSVPEYADMYPVYRAMTEGELRLFPMKKYGAFYTSYYVECSKLLPILLKRFERRGGRVIQQKVNRLNELSGRFDVVVNCTGIGSVQLVGDSKLRPIRGQVIRVRAPWIKTAIMSDDIYIIPNTDEVILGGTHQDGDWNLIPNPEDRARIWKGCVKLMPSLEGAEVIRDWVGLRPGRPSLRLELEAINTQNGCMQVVHNYGHGGSGVSLAWGCAEDVVKLVNTALDGTVKASL